MPTAPLSKATIAARGRVAGLSKQNATDSRIPAAQRDYRAARLEDHIRATLATAPPLTAAQRQHLAALLAPAGDAL